MTVLVTGAAGFIGAAVCERLLERGERVLGVDNLNSYYDPALKQARLDRLDGMASAAPLPSAAGQGIWSFHRLDLADGEAMADLFAATKPRALSLLVFRYNGSRSESHCFGLPLATWCYLA